MPDILIRGMVIPKGCYFCKLNYHGRGCSITGTMYESDTMVLMDFDEYTQRLKDCPLVELPEHGDLIDVSKVVLEYGGLAKISPYDFVGIAKYFAEQLEEQPAIVPAERREE